MSRLIRDWLGNRDLDRRLRKRRRARTILSEAARRGQSTYWRNAGAKCRAMFGGGSE